jgi:hypothetical protein
MTKPFYLLVIGLLLTISAVNLQANNMELSNANLTGQNTTEHYTLVRFDFIWENFWRTCNLNGDGLTNWDATCVRAGSEMSGVVSL